MELIPIPKQLLDRKWAMRDVYSQGEHEQEYAEKKVAWLVSEPMTDEEKRYLLVTTLPWTSKPGLAPLLGFMWQPFGCVRCSDVLRNRWALPSGCLNARYMVIGEAPGASTKGRPDHTMSRNWAYGKSARILRKATAMAGIYWSTWFTNLIKCPVVDRKPSAHEEANCQMFLATELRSIQPHTVVLLGKHVQQSFPAVSGMKVVRLPHPSYYARKGSLARAMAKDLIVAMKGAMDAEQADEKADREAGREASAAAEGWDGKSPLGV